MARNKIYHYYVEGEDDRKIVNTLKTDLQVIEPGKVDKFNVVTKELNKNHIRILKQGTIVVLVFDTDTENIEILKKNIEFLKNQKNIVADVICITQVNNLEDELVRSCSIKKISELTKSRSNKDFKSDVLHISNLEKRLEECNFQISRFWSSKPKGIFEEISNDAGKIKK